MTLDEAIRGTLLLDGGMGTELERNGCNVRDHLWSARVLLDHPEEIAKVHRSYLESGAQCLITASYQISFGGFARAGLTPADAEHALRSSVEIARKVRDDFAKERGSHALIAASVGPYGGALADGSEFHGNYACTYADLIAFHAWRMQVLASAQPDLLACETIPALEEVRAILECLHALPGAKAWFTFSCRDERHISHGEELRECARLLHAELQVVAMGVNCTAPKYVASLVREVAAVTSKPIVVYPNSGRQWDAASRQWLGPGGGAFVQLANTWREAGASWIGGCCGTGPEDIASLRDLLAA